MVQKRKTDIQPQAQMASDFDPPTIKLNGNILALQVASSTAVNPSGHGEAIHTYNPGVMKTLLPPEFDFALQMDRPTSCPKSPPDRYIRLTSKSKFTIPAKGGPRGPVWEEWSRTGSAA